MTSIETDLELVQQSQAGDLEAFNRLVELYQNGVYGLCYRLLGGKEAAEDATQEAFISAFTHLDSFRQGSFKSWIMRIAANASYDELRRRARRPTVSIDYDEDDESGGAVSVPDAGPLPEELTLRKELREAVEAGLQSLQEDQRMAVILCDLQELAYEEIAQITHSSIGTVKSRISRGRARLREYLRERGELLPEQMR